MKPLIGTKTCRSFPLIAVFLFFCAFSGFAQSRATSSEDSVKTLLLNKKWYAYQMNMGSQSLDVPKERECYFLFTKDEIQMKMDEDLQREAYTLDAKNKTIVLTKYGEGNFKIIKLTKTELKLQLLEGTQYMGMAFRTTPNN
jgi:hypothetical protein